MPGSTAAACPVCSAKRTRAFSQVILSRHQVDYFTCDGCGLLQTEPPYWLDEAYDRVIGDLDTGLLARNQAVARQLSLLLYVWFGGAATFLDLAGGYGVLTRLMRDIGFRFYWEDRYCENLFARGFEADPAACFDAVTALEVMEHVPDPCEFLTDALGRSRGGVVIVTTELFSGRPPPPDWWYYTPDTGQHITFYQLRTLQALARRLDCQLLSRGALHIFTRTRRNRMLAMLAMNRIGRTSFRLVRRRLTSLTFSDHMELRMRLSSARVSR